MTNPFGSSRKRAEAVFGKTKSLARSRTASENDAITQARDEKTNRLRALRKAKEASDLAAALPLEDVERPGG